MVRPTSLSCILQKAGEEGEREGGRLHWVRFSPPTDPSTSAGAKGTERALSSFLSAAVQIRISEFKELTTFLKNFTLLYLLKTVGAANLTRQREGLLDQPRQAVENRPYVCRISPFTEPQTTLTEAACKFEGVYFSIQCPFALHAHPGTLSALQALQLARWLLPNYTTPPLDHPASKPNLPSSSPNFTDSR